MKRALFALAIGAAIFLSSDAQARLDLAAAQCTEPNLAPSERVKYCKLYADSGSSGTGGLAERRELLAEADRLAGNYAEAENLLTVSMAFYSARGLVLARRAIVYAEDGKYALAIADSDAVVKERAGDFYALSNRCWVRAIAGQELDAAMDDCKKALAFHPQNAATLDSLAFIDYKRGDMKAALEDYNAALTASSHEWSSLYMRGIVKRETGYEAEGDADISDALSHAPYIGQEFAGYGVKQPDLAEPSP